MRTTADHEPHSQYVSINKTEADCNHSTTLMMKHSTGDYSM